MKLPVTRYYGSKRKLVDKIWAILEQEGVEFDSFLDLFGGTGIAVDNTGLFYLKENAICFIIAII